MQRSKSQESRARWRESTNWASVFRIRSSQRQSLPPIKRTFWTRTPSVPRAPTKWRQLNTEQSRWRWWTHSAPSSIRCKQRTSRMGDRSSANWIRRSSLMSSLSRKTRRLMANWSSKSLYLISTIWLSLSTACSERRKEYTRSPSKSSNNASRNASWSWCVYPPTKMHPEVAKMTALPANNPQCLAKAVDLRMPKSRCRRSARAKSTRASSRDRACAENLLKWTMSHDWRSPRLNMNKSCPTTMPSPRVRPRVQESWKWAIRGRRRYRPRDSTISWATTLGTPTQK